MNKNHVKYLTTSDEDNNWGLYLKVVGSVKISPTDNYPSRIHP